MKKLITWILALTMTFSLCACGGESEKPVSSAASEPVEESAPAVETASEPETAEETASEEESAEPEPTQEELDAQTYEEAKEALDSGNYAKALSGFRSLGAYEDAQSLRKTAAFALVREYLKANGGEIDPVGNGWSFPYGIIQVDDPVLTYVGLDANDNICFGVGRDTSNPSMNIICYWTFYMELGEESDTAPCYFADHTTMSYGDRSMEENGYGETSCEIAAYTEDTSFDFTVTQDMTNYLGETTTEEKDITAMYEQEGRDEMGHAPISAFDLLLSDSGASLEDLGFAALENGSAPAAVESDAEQGNESAPAEEGSIDLFNEDGTGELKYAGWEYLPDGVMADEQYVNEKFLVVLMDYTNTSDEPKQQQNDFWYRAYQNGVELDSSVGSYHSDMYEPLSDYFKEVMMGGTVTTGKYFLLEDDSPVTIIANEQGNSDNKQTMVINLK